MTDLTLEELAVRSVGGDKAALEALVFQIQNQVYGLALRMLWQPQEAEDATQEILVRVVTHIGTFRHESVFSTWVYRIAANYLLRVRKSRSERAEMSFEEFGDDLDKGLVDEDDAAQPDRALLLEEVKIGCTHAMLLCLDREHRLAFILGEIFELDHSEGAAALNVSTAAFRKRVSRARQLLVDFTRRKCGIVNPDSRCRCRKRVHAATSAGRVDPERLLFRDRVGGGKFQEVLSSIRRLEEGRRTVALYRSHGQFSTSEEFVQAVRDLTRQI